MQPCDSGARHALRAGVCAAPGLVIVSPLNLVPRGVEIVESYWPAPSHVRGRTTLGPAAPIAGAAPGGNARSSVRRIVVLGWALSLCAAKAPAQQPDST